MKGQKARSGGGVRPGFEGGQLPLTRRMARKRGFRNPFRVQYEEVNVGALARFDAGSEVTAATLAHARLIRSAGRPVKVLGDGDLAVALTVEAAAFSAPARAKIEAAGGTVRWTAGDPSQREVPETKRTRRRDAAVVAQRERLEASATAKAERAAAKEAPKPKGKPEASPKGKPKAKASAGDGTNEKRARAPKDEDSETQVEESTGPAEVGQEEAQDGAGS
jgi:large subunit ribosomal protein L15